jgi:hypothetical protein
MKNRSPQWRGKLSISWELGVAEGIFW